MYTYAERLRWAMDQTAPPTTLRGLARQIGVRYQSIQYLRDPNRNAKGSRHNDAIANALGISAQWLATGKGKSQLGKRPCPDPRPALRDCIRSARSLLGQLERLAAALDETSHTGN